jgi:hypothetical protein
MKNKFEQKIQFYFLPVYETNGFHLRKMMNIIFKQFLRFRTNEKTIF